MPTGRIGEFARLQDAFQRGVLEADDAVLAEILDSPQEKRTVLFDVYRSAYVARLAEAMGKDHEFLRAYLGDDGFDTMARAYVAACPSRHPNLRWFSQRLPDFLRGTEPYREHPEAAELAALEKALNDAFDAVDAPVLAVTDLAGIPPQAWNDITFRPHPSAVRLDAGTNAAAIWTALRNEDTPPPAATADAPVRLLVWRQEGTSKFRELATEEAMMWDEAASGIAFGVLCAMLATYDDPDGAAARAAGYLQGWINAGLLTGVSLD